MARSKNKTIDRLVQFGLQHPLARRAYLAFGSNAVSEIRRDPYILLLLNERSDWREVDRIANEMGIEKSAPVRIAGAIRHALLHGSWDGHIFLPDEELYRRSYQFLGFKDEGILTDTLEELYERREVHLSINSHEQGRSIYLWRFHEAENEIARRTRNLSLAPSSMALKEPSPDEMTKVEKTLRITLAFAQREAIAAAFQNKVTIVTGGPGTGKTTILKGILKLWRMRGGSKPRLAAPTGRAAKRLSESTGRFAKTIHRLLEYNPETGGFNRNAGRTLKTDLLVVDEASMIDTELMANLLAALEPSCHLLIVGDVDQLPAVGPGMVLHDLIGCGHIKTVSLTEIFRQREGSLISLNAHRINQGEMPELEGDGVEQGQDFFFVAKPDPILTRDAVLELVTSRIPKQFGFDPKQDIQVLCPMIKYGAGVEVMNEHLQERINPSPDRFKPGFYPMACGDKIMQTKNDYLNDVFNGDIGFVTEIDQDDERVTIEFEGRKIDYKYSDLVNTSLAYAVTVHKSQGSEYPAVVVPLIDQHFPLLQRNLLYTAVSRGKTAGYAGRQPQGADNRRQQ